MKHVSVALLSAVLVLLLAGCASTPAASVKSVQSGDVSDSTARSREDRGTVVPSIAEGVVAQIGNNGLPVPFGQDTVVIDTAFNYWFKDERVSVEAQLLVGGINPFPSLAVGQEVDGDTEIGTAAATTISLNVRSRSFDPYLAMCALYDSTYIQQVGDWYYYGMGVFQALTELDFQPLASADDGYQFWDYPESLRDIYESGFGQYEETGKSVISNYPNMGFCIKTVLTEWPSEGRKFKTDLSPANRIMVERQFEELPYSVEIDWDGIPLQLFCVDQCVADLQEYYELGDPVYLYLRANMAVNGELCCIMWDFNYDDPTSYASEAQAYAESYIDMQ